MDSIRKKPGSLSSVYSFLAPIAAVFLVTIVVSNGCQEKTVGKGTVKFLFTGDVGGRLDPCG